MQKEKNGRARKIVLSAFAAEARKARRRTDLKNFRDDLILTVWNSVFKFAFPRPVVSHNNFAIVSISNDSPEYVYLAFYFGWLVCWLLGRLDAWLFGWYFSRLRGIVFRYCLRCYHFTITYHPLKRCLIDSFPIIRFLKSISFFCLIRFAFDLFRFVYFSFVAILWMSVFQWLQRVRVCRLMSTPWLKRLSEGSLTKTSYQKNRRRVWCK